MKNEIIEKAIKLLKNADTGSIDCKNYNNGFIDGLEYGIESVKKQACISSYKAGMMQGFRILQSFMTFQQQKDFGFTDNDEKINERLENELKKWLKDN